MRAALAIVFSLLVATAASAQIPDAPAQPSEADIARARDQFVHGMELAQAESWDAALSEFVGSYAQSGSPVALYNIGSALRALRRFREARMAFDRLLEDAELDPDMRANAAQMRSEMTAQIAVFTIDGVPAGPARVTADDELREVTEVRPIEVELDPGPHTLALEHPTRGVWRWSGSMSTGAEERATASFEDGAGGIDVVVPIVASAIVAALAVIAIVAGVVADEEAQLDPRTPLVIHLP